MQNYPNEEEEEEDNRKSDNYEGGNDRRKMLDKEKQEVDFNRALQNLSDIMIDSNKFKFMISTLYDAIDTENIGTISCQQVEQFVRDFLHGDGSYGMDTNFSDNQDTAYKMLRDNEAGRVNKEELSKFMWELTRQQIVNLQKRIER